MTEGKQVIQISDINNLILVQTFTYTYTQNQV